MLAGRCLCDLGVLTPLLCHSSRNARITVSHYTLTIEFVISSSVKAALEVRPFSRPSQFPSAGRDLLNLLSSRGD